MNDGERTFSIEELTEFSGISRRTIRYYVQVGLLDPPQGAARGAYYTRGHLQRLLDIQAWQSDGLTLDGIRQRLATPAEAPVREVRAAIEVWTRLTLSEGVELNLNPEVAGLTTDQVRKLAGRVTAALQAIKEEDSND
jgi:DNA-binding transcriptional MerR regulator